MPPSGHGSRPSGGPAPTRPDPPLPATRRPRAFRKVSPVPCLPPVTAPGRPEAPPRPGRIPRSLLRAAQEPSGGPARFQPAACRSRLPACRRPLPAAIRSDPLLPAAGQAGPGPAGGQPGTRPLPAAGLSRTCRKLRPGQGESPAPRLVPARIRSAPCPVTCPAPAGASGSRPGLATAPSPPPPFPPDPVPDPT
jgi:hypothetical protein